ncbi:MAG: DNA mismatch repair protein MutS [Alphaproteobacteria bacterium]|jgi:DNA-nicking Smr family endonuclease|nr:MAG: DNA mismatch repair protein MutS [Alphaproteobacteria bacterium]
MSRRLTPDERKLWSRVARTVRLAPGRVIDVEPEPEPEAHYTPTPANPPKAGQPTHPVARRPSAPDDLSGQRRIRRGQHEIDARIDLHGHTQDTAHREVVDFILRQAALGARCVLVITGKGRLGTGVLRARLFDWIANPDLRPFIAGYAAAHPRHGGAGAVYLFLRSANR